MAGALSPAARRALARTTNRLDHQVAEIATALRIVTGIGSVVSVADLEPVKTWAVRALAGVVTVRRILAAPRPPARLSRSRPSSADFTTKKGGA